MEQEDVFKEQRVDPLGNNRLPSFGKTEWNVRLAAGVNGEIGVQSLVWANVARNCPAKKMSSQGFRELPGSATVTGKSHLEWQMGRCPLMSIKCLDLWLCFTGHGEPRMSLQKGDNEMEEEIAGLCPARYSRCNHRQIPLFLSDPYSPDSISLPDWLCGFNELIPVASTLWVVRDCVNERERKIR